jgi:nitroimidazol reductase NimA-like FMN-containing flavoprotein (pyridoxamine 5'-phosphate oxidase superfamily)
MPAAPLPPDLERFVTKPLKCVLATVRRDSSPVTVPCWYEYVDGRVMLSMGSDATRLRHIRENPNVALTILGDDWYNQVSLLGRVVELRDDVGLVGLDRLSRRYTDMPYPDRQPCVLATVEVDRWHTFGSPAGEVSGTVEREL